MNIQEFDQTSYVAGLTLTDDTTIKLPKYKAKLIMGEENGYSLIIMLPSKLNWFQRLMYKVCFGFKAKNIKDEE